MTEPLLPSSLAWPAWVAMLAARALLSDDAEAHVLRGLAGWEPNATQVALLEEAVPSLDTRHTRAGLAEALALAADAGGTFRANAAGLGLVALVAAATGDLDDPATLDDPDDLAFAEPELVLDSSPAMTEPLVWIAGAVVPLAEAAADLVDPREVLRRVADHPRLLPHVARLARDVLAGSASDRQVARRLARLAERVAGLAPGVLDVDGRGRLLVGGRPLYWLRRRDGGRTDRCWVSSRTRAGRLLLALVQGQRPAATPSEVTSQLRVALLRVGVRLDRSLGLAPRLRASTRTVRAWRLLGSDLPAEPPRRRRRARAKS